MNTELLTALAVVILLLVGRGIYLANESLKRLESRQREQREQIKFRDLLIEAIQKKRIHSTRWGII